MRHALSISPRKSHSIDGLPTVSSKEHLAPEEVLAPDHVPPDMKNTRGRIEPSGIFAQNPKVATDSASAPCPHLEERDKHRYDP
jgi:hypothetical protein